MPNFAPLIAALFFAFPGNARGDLTITGCDKQKIAQQVSPGYEDTFRKMIKEKLGDAKVEWNSCYRSTEEQRKICGKMPGCSPEGCPGRCAPPGRSNHQHVSTADVQKIPGDVKAGCEFLYNVCQTMRGQDINLACEIGGYGAGAHHLAVGKGIRNNAYNQCAYLKPKMGAPPPKTDELKKDGDDLFKKIMDTPPAAPPSGGGGDDGGSGAGSPGNAQYPTALADAHPGATSPTPSHGGTSTAPTDPSAKKAAPNGHDSERGVSDITRFNSRPLPRDGAEHENAAMSAAGAGSNALGMVSTAGGGGAGVSVGHESSANAAGNAVSTETKKDAATNEVLSSFAGGSKLGFGGKGGLSGVETESVVKSMMSELAGQDGREPASQSGDEIGEPDGESLFARCHAAHERCLYGGCVTRK